MRVKPLNKSFTPLAVTVKTPQKLNCRGEEPHFLVVAVSRLNKVNHSLSLALSLSLSL